MGSLSHFAVAAGKNGATRETPRRLESPKSVWRNERAAALALAGLTAACIAAWDEDVDLARRLHRDEFPFAVVRGLGQLGHAYGKSNARVAILFGGLSGSMMAAGIALDDDKLVTTTVLFAQSFAVTMLATAAVKMTVGRERPYREKGAHAFEYFEFSSDGARRSMPSGHTAAAFSMMTVIAKQYPKWWVQLPAYTFAVGAGLQRIDAREHWTSDVLAGAALGYFVASRVVARHSSDGDKKYSPALLVSPGRLGVALRL